VRSEFTDRRLYWILSAVLMFFGIFAASTRGPIPSHIPQCAGARAIGARTSLASAKRETQPPQVATLPLLLAAAVALCAPVVTLQYSQVMADGDRIVRPSIFRPALLFRPPPANSLA
jgi:hypothetical protein